MTLFRFKCSRLEVCMYTAPSVYKLWKQRSLYYKKGFILRVGILGFVFRVGKRKLTELERILSGHIDYRRY